jgi:hypothetical protein
MGAPLSTSLSFSTPHKAQSLRGGAMEPINEYDASVHDGSMSCLAARVQADACSRRWLG